MKGMHSVYLGFTSMVQASIVMRTVHTCSLLKPGFHWQRGRSRFDEKVKRYREALLHRFEAIYLFIVHRHS